jgi:hypothetical protein
MAEGSRNLNAACPPSAINQPDAGAGGAIGGYLLGGAP